MFTGIIEEVGSVRKMLGTGVGKRVSVFARTVLDGILPGESIAVNGVCVTVVRRTDSEFEADVSSTTLEKTTFGTLSAGDPVNLERAMRADGRFGGHLVQGHIDQRGQVERIEQDGEFLVLEIGFDPKFDPLVVPTGSLAIDGVSLTVAKLESGLARCAVIPHTAKQTIIPNYRPGTAVNLEFDIVGKYIARSLNPMEPSRGGLSAERLAELGY